MSSSDGTAEQRINLSQISDNQRSSTSDYIDSTLLKKLLQNNRDYVEDEIKGLRRELYSIRNELSDTQTKYIEILGVFVAVFTFISIDFQILRTVKSIPGVTGLLLISAGLLMLFVLLVHYISKQRLLRIDQAFKNLLKISIICMASGLFFVCIDIYLENKNDFIFGKENTKIKSLDVLIIETEDELGSSTFPEQNEILIK